MDTYSVYCVWCDAHHYAKPSREWWNKACAAKRPTVKVVSFEPDFDIETERREGWGYDRTL